MSSFPLLGCLVLAILMTIPHASDAVSCTIPEYNADDIRSATRDCTEITLRNLHVPPGATLELDLRNGTKVYLEGSMTWGYEEWNGPLLRISGDNVEIYGGSSQILEGKGYLWWDGLGEHGGTVKPTFVVLHNLTNSRVEDIVLSNSPYRAITIEDSYNVTLEGIFVYNQRGNALGGLNTDGIDIQRSHYITLQTIGVDNQGDCIAVKSGSNIVISQGFCMDGYGLAIGSVGGRDLNVVENVLIKNFNIYYSDNGVRIKTIYYATGSITNVTFSNIYLVGVKKYGIVVEGDLTQNDDSTGIPTGGVPIKDLILDEIYGTVVSTGVNIYVLVQNASNWYWSGINISGGLNNLPCQGVPGGGGAHC